MEQHAAFARDSADFFNILNDADLVVGGHDRDQNGVVGNRVFQVVQIHEPLVVDRQKRDSESILFQVLAGIEDRLVFGDGRDDVVALLAVHGGDAFDGQII